MKIYTSYFYQIRNFTPNIIPLSTAISDPSWYHNGRNKYITFFDKRGIINGLRAEPFVPGPQCHDLCHGAKECGNSPSQCTFLQVYREQLNKLNFEDILARFYQLNRKMRALENTDWEYKFALIFHEAPTNPCSERWAVQDWFKAHGYNIEEFKKGE